MRMSSRPLKKVDAIFYKTEAGAEPVREALLDLPKNERVLVGRDIAKVEFGWPIGMPTSKPLGKGLHEVRTDLPNRISRVFFYVSDAEKMVLLHAIMKKTQKTPPEDLEIARDRMGKHQKAAKAAKAPVKKPAKKAK